MSDNFDNNFTLIYPFYFYFFCIMLMIYLIRLKSDNNDNIEPETIIIERLPKYELTSEDTLPPDYSTIEL